MARAGLSVLGSGYSGKAGPVVFARFRDGSVQIRQRDTPHDPATQGQLRARQAMRLANRFFRGLTLDELRAWKRYAERLADAAWAERRPMQVNPLNAYRTLALKFIQLNGPVEPPRLPPAAPFAGDGVLVTAAAQPGSVLFQASGPNAAGVLTELLLQPVPTGVSTPESDKFRHQAFVAFAPGSITAAVPAKRGWVVPAIRFVLTGTGQASPVLALEPVLVD